MNVALPECPGPLPALPPEASAGQRCVLRYVHWRRSPPDIARKALSKRARQRLRRPQDRARQVIGVLTRTATPESP